MIPESKLIRSEITIRDLSITNDVKLAKKSMVRWLALSLGLVSPNESRTLILDILTILFKSHIKMKKLTFQQIFDQAKELNKSDITQKAVYYHLLRLKDKGVLKSRDKLYFISEDDISLSKVLVDIYSSMFKRSIDKVSKIASAFEN